MPGAGASEAWGVAGQSGSRQRQAETGRDRQGREIRRAISTRCLPFFCAVWEYRTGYVIGYVILSGALITRLFETELYVYFKMC